MHWTAAGRRLAEGLQDAVGNADAGDAPGTDTAVCLQFLTDRTNWSM